MNTLFVTNILLAVIVFCIIVVSICLTIFLVHSISIAKRVKYIVKTFDDDVHRTRSVILSLKDLVLQKIGLLPTKKHK